MIALVLGGTRSGKSEVGERLARALATPDGSVTYVATATATDAEFGARIARHRARRPTTWTTVEVGRELPDVLRVTSGLALVDSVGGWVAASDFDPAIGELCAAVRDRSAPTVLVAEEVGLGVHPPTAPGVRFADAVGAANRALCDVADHVLLVAAGRAVVLDDSTRVVDDLLGRVTGRA